MKVQSTIYIDFISKTVDVLLISSFITKQMPKLLIFDAFTLLICKKNVAIYALLRCKIFSLKIWVCKIFDKFHVCAAHKGRFRSRMVTMKGGVAKSSKIEDARCKILKRFCT